MTKDTEYSTLACANKSKCAEKIDNLRKLEEGHAERLAEAKAIYEQRLREHKHVVDTIGAFFDELHLLAKQ